MSTIGSIFSGLFGSIKTAEEKAVLPALGTAVVNIAANPTEGNAIAQGAIFLDTLVVAAVQSGSIGTILPEVSGLISTAAQSYVNNEIAKLTAPKVAAVEPAKAA